MSQYKLNIKIKETNYLTIKGKQYETFHSDFHLICLVYIISASGNSEDETDEREMFDTKLASIARGQVNPDWDILFGDGEQGADENLYIRDHGYTNTKMVCIECRYLYIQS